MNSASACQPAIGAARTRPTARLLVVIDGYEVTGPAKQLLAAHARLAPELRTTIAVIQRGREETPLLTAVRATGLPLTVFRERFRFDPAPAVALACHARRIGADIIQTHGYKANVFAALISRIVRVPWVAFLHGETYEGWKIRTYFALERVVVRRAARVVVVSEAMGHEVARCGVPAHAIRVIHNASVTSRSAAAAWGTYVPVVGVIPHLTLEKGFDLAFRAHAHVIAERPTATLLIAGVGSEEGELKRLAERLGIEPSVTWLGYQRDVEALLRRLMVLLVPSRSEGSPNVILEAMAHGVPVVATAVGGVPELIANGESGLLVSPGDDRSLAESILRLCHDVELRRRLAKQAAQEVEARFSVDVRVTKLAALYRGIHRNGS